MGGFGVAMPQSWLHASLKSAWSICLFRAQNVLHWTPLCGRGAPWEELFIDGLWQSIPDWDNDSKSHPYRFCKIYSIDHCFGNHESSISTDLPSFTPNPIPQISGVDTFTLVPSTECPGHAMLTARHESHVTCLKVTFSGMGLSWGMFIGNFTC